MSLTILLLVSSLQSRQKIVILSLGVATKASFAAPTNLRPYSKESSAVDQSTTEAGIDLEFHEGDRELNILDTRPPVTLPPTAETIASIDENDPYILVEEVNNNTLTWNEARDYCVQLGSYLATVHKYQTSVLSQVDQILEMRDTCSTSNRGNCYIGLRLSHDLYRFRWGENDNSIFDSEVLNPTIGQLAPPEDYVVSRTNWGSDGFGDSLGDGATPTSTIVVGYQYECVISSGGFWKAFKCDAVENEYYDTAAFLCENPQYIWPDLPPISPSPTNEPSEAPSPSPVASPSSEPSNSPTKSQTPTGAPTLEPTGAPVVPQSCLPRQADCSNDSQCCSGNCKKNGNKKNGHCRRPQG